MCTNYQYETQCDATAASWRSPRSIAALFRQAATFIEPMEYFTLERQNVRVGYDFEWNPKKAEANLSKHGVSFAEAITVFGDPLSMNMADPDHSRDEHRFIVLGMSDRYRLLVSRTPGNHRERESSVLGQRLDMSDDNMKKPKGKTHPRGSDKDTMRPEYDFSKAVRGVTAARYAEGTNVVLLDPDVAELFPDSRAANEALRTIARLMRRSPRKRSGTRTA